MRKSFLIPALMVILFALGACEKDEVSTKIKASGSLSASERALLGQLPAGAQIVFGGSYKDFMDYWEHSPIKKLSEDMMSAVAGSGEGMSDYMNCWVEVGSDVELVGSMEVQASTGTIRMVFSGLGSAALSKCAEKGGFAIKKDADGKYLEIDGLPDGQGGVSSASYYFIDDKTTYFAQGIPLGMALGSPPSRSTRATLEADLAKASTSPAVDNPDIKAMLEKADRSKAFWFSGSAKGTPIADSLRGGHGWIGVNKTSMSIGFSVDLVEAGSATAAVGAFNEAKGQLDMLDMLGPEGKELKKLARSFLKDAALEAKGNTLKGRFRITNALLEKAAPLMKDAMGGMGGMGGMP